MNSRDLAVGIFCVFQTALGMLGNSVLLCGFFIADFSGIRAKKPTDLIVKHLTSANFIVLCRGVPQSIAIFNQSYYLDFISCKIALYFHRVARGVSLGSTSLLSVFQAITISPSNSKWAQLKVRTPRIIGPSLGLCWASQLLLRVFIPVYTTDITGDRNVTGIKDLGYCVGMNSESRIITFIMILYTFSDFMFLGTMMWSSGYMVLILLNHKERVKHIHRSLSPRSLPEIRATKSILTLVSSFVLFYVISSVFTSYLSLLDVTIKLLFNIAMVMTASFPALCPFLLMRQYTSFFRLGCTCSYYTTTVLV